MKPLYFFVPDYNEYMKDRGINVNIFEELPTAVFEDAEKLASSIKNDEYDFNSLYSFKEKYVELAKSGNTEVLAKFISLILNK
jgi:CDP-glycerol glycerophosphotransferase (TagB/SpsB family)